MTTLPAKIYKHPHLDKCSIWWKMYFEFKIRLVDLVRKNFIKLHEI